MISNADATLAADLIDFRNADVCRWQRMRHRSFPSLREGKPSNAWCQGLRDSERDEQDDEPCRKSNMLMVEIVHTATASIGVSSCDDGQRRLWESRGTEASRRGFLVCMEP
jgi:hypothetical protein